MSTNWLKITFLRFWCPLIGLKLRFFTFLCLPIGLKLRFLHFSVYGFEDFYFFSVVVAKTFDTHV